MTCYFILDEEQNRFQSTRLHEAWLGHASRRGHYKPCFNPHACMRRDTWATSSKHRLSVFQSTRLHEAWLQNNGLVIKVVKFQSTRLHEAWHKLVTEFTIPVVVSIHTPAWGVTSRYKTIIITILCFNPHACMRRDYPCLRHITK